MSRADDAERRVAEIDSRHAAIRTMIAKHVDEHYDCLAGPPPHPIEFWIVGVFAVLGLFAWYFS